MLGYWFNGVSQIAWRKTFLFNIPPRKFTKCSLLDICISFKVLAARKTYLITARARKNKRTAPMLASARKDHSIPLTLTEQAHKSYIGSWTYRK